MCIFTFPLHFMDGCLISYGYVFTANVLVIEDIKLDKRMKKNVRCNLDELSKNSFCEKVVKNVTLRDL